MEPLGLYLMREVSREEADPRPQQRESQVLKTRSGDISIEADLSRVRGHALLTDKHTEEAGAGWAPATVG